MSQLVQPKRDFTIPVVIFTLTTFFLKFFVFKGISFVDSMIFLTFISSLYFLVTFPMNKYVQIVLGILVLFVGIPIIGFQNTSSINVVIDIAIYAALALGLNIVVGFAGLLDLGYVAFFAVGAYLWAIFGSAQATELFGWQLPENGFFLIAIVAVLVAAMFGVLLGLPVLRLKGDYLAIVTLGLGEVIRVIANNNPGGLTKGSVGIDSIEQPLHTFTSSLGSDGYKWQSLVFYVIVLAVIAVAILVTNRLDQSRIGRAWTAIREDEIAAQAMGIPLVATKLVAFATGASFAGIMGTIFAAKQSFVDPASFDVNQSIGVLAMVVLGGLGSIRGAVVGAAVVTSLNLVVLPTLAIEFNNLRQSGTLNLPPQFEVSKYQRLIYGIILIVMMIYRSQGLVPASRKHIEVDDAHAGKGAMQGGD
jgi:branched-chain amino acid transport system permease protein